MAKSSFRGGIARASRNAASGGRQEVNPQQQLNGMYIGIVMDDFDEQRLGQIWVYVSGISARRYNLKDAVPTYGGTVPDRDNPEAQLRWDQALRNGWIQCVPIFPFFGGDDYRVQNSPGGDFRNANNGDVVSYGFWAQPRNGDEVAVMFANGDPQKAFWMGCVPKYNRNFMVPGSPGRPPDDLDSKADQQIEDGPTPVVHKITKKLKDEAPRDPSSLVPALDKARRLSNDPTNPVEKELIDVLASPEFALNTQQAGLLCDVLRGAGNSSARRESPSYVAGMKSAGWNFDSEKKNLNTAGGSRTRFQDEASKYGAINTTGHQITMDDHPDFQGMRLRTSAGSQLYFADSCNDPFIYISTAKGSVWIEMIDDGKINVYSKDSMSFHSQKDINFTADRDINMDAQRDLKVQVRRNTEIKLKGTTNMEIGKNDLPPQELNYGSGGWGVGAPGNMFIQNYGSVDWVIDGHLGMSVGTGMDLKITGNGVFESTINLDFKAGLGVFIEATTNMDIKAGTTMSQDSSSFFYVTSGAGYFETAPIIHMNGPSGAPAIPASTASIATAPTIQPTIKTYIAPTADEIVNCKDPTNTFDTLSDMTVPQHQPWPEACELSIGFSGFVDISSTEETRQGAARVDALTPITKIQSTGVFQGNPYATSTTGEAPTFTKIRDVEPGELNPCSSYTTSDKGIDFLQRHEGFKTKAYRDADGFSIGFGHFLTAGDQITGVLNGQDISRPLTTEDVRTIRRTEGALVITDSEARRIFREDLVRFEQAVCSSVTIEITQGQFDGMVSFAYNVGPGNLSKMIVSSGLNSGDFTAVPSSWMKYSKCPRCLGNRGRVEAVLARRRREELEQLFSAVA